MRHKYSKEEIERLEHLYKNEKDWNKILEEFPWTNRHGYNEFARRRGWKRNLPKCKGSLLPLLANNLEAFYWAGFIAADGCIQNDNQLMVVQSIDNKKHLEKLAGLLSLSVQYLGHAGGYSDKTEIVRINILDSQNIHLIKNKFDFKTQKTYNPPSFDAYRNFSYDEKMSFLIGFIDGDGYVNERGIKLENHISWKDFLYSLLKSLDLQFGIHKSKYCRIGIFKESSNVIKNYVETHNLPVMKRKWNDK